MAEAATAAAGATSSGEEEAGVVLSGATDIYGGVTVDADGHLPALHHLSAVQFAVSLAESLALWQEQGKRGIWLKLGPITAHFVQPALQHGFRYHNAQGAVATLCRWLPKDEPDKLPLFVHTYIGVGGMVLDDQNRVLVVCERFRHTEAKIWKLPGGLSDPDEEIGDTAIREVEEETGVKTEFRSLLTFRHVHGVRFGCGDIYFVVLLKPTTTQITFDEREILDCKWMPLDEYLDQASHFNKFTAECLRKALDRQEHGLQTKVLPATYTKTKTQLAYAWPSHVE